MSDSTGLEFGLFLAPIHQVGRNPTRVLEEDLGLIQHAEAIGFREAWVGEHHSGGSELIGPSDIFIAAAVERTRHIRIGTGVTTVPYHHPFHVAERAVMLDHLSRGRTMLGVGPGSLPTDASMLGVPWMETRKRLQEGWTAIHHLLTSPEPLTMKTDWFELNEAALQVAPYSKPTMELAFTGMESPFGPSMAGKYGTTLISMSGTTASGHAALRRHWSVVEQEAAEHGREVSRENWAVVAMVHIAETDEQARQEVAKGLLPFADYNARVAERALDSLAPGADGKPLNSNQVVDALTETGIAVIGTPDDAIRTIQGIQEASGGFGRLLVMVCPDWASPEATRRSMDLFAREVAPVFETSPGANVRSAERVSRTKGEAATVQRASIEAAQASYVPPSSV